MSPRAPAGILGGVEAAPADELRRPLAIGGAAAWLMVGLPVLLHWGIPGWRLGAWAAVWLAFFAFSAGALRTRDRARLALLALAVGTVTAMVLLLCDGFEGALLVLVALRLGGTVSRRVGLIWIGVQTALLAAAVAVHWSPPPALLLAPPYLGFSVLAFFVADVLARSAAQRRALAAANAELRSAQRLALENTRLAERVRIARDLHDAVGSRLTALGMNIEVAAKLASGDAREPIATARELVRSALREVRAVVEHLRDEERIDVAQTLRALASEMPAPRVHLVVPDGVCRDDPERAVALLRCTQEIITNAARHASAQNLWIEIAESDAGAVELTARDDGVGVSADAGAPASGNGLRGMRERVESTGGHLAVMPGAGRGFHVRATLPARRP
jgi:signal transduction histidine kinase